MLTYNMLDQNCIEKISLKLDGTVGWIKKSKSNHVLTAQSNLCQGHLFYRIKYQKINPIIEY